MIALVVLLQTTLTIGVSGPPTSIEYLPLRVAEAEGYFAAEQVSVSLRSFRAEAEPAEALAQGRVDLAATSLRAALSLGHAKGVPPRLTFGLTAAAPVVLLVARGHRDSIRELSDLAGKVVGIPAPGTPESQVLLSLLVRAGVNRRRVVIQSYGERGLASALASGAEVTAGVLGDPWASQLIDDGHAVALVDLRNRQSAPRWFGAETVNAAVFARANTGLGAPELTALARALLKAVARLRDAPPEELARRLPPAVVGLPEQWRARIGAGRQAVLPDGRVSPERLQASIRLLQAATPLPAVLQLPRRTEALLFTAPLEEALKGPVQ